MSVLSAATHCVSAQPPPMPIHADEYSRWPRLWGRAVGTRHRPEIWVKRVPFRSMAPASYPNQFEDWLAPTRTMSPWGTRVGAAGAGRARAATIAKTPGDRFMEAGMRGRERNRPDIEARACSG